MDSQVPAGIKIIAGFFVLSAAVGIEIFVAGIVMVVLGRSLALLAIAMGAMITLIAVPLALGLLHKKNWARILVLIFAVIQVAAQLLRIGMATAPRDPLTMVKKGIWLVIWGVATTYLLQPQIKSVFTNH